MRPVLATALTLLASVPLSGQEQSAYTPAENPYQAEHEFAAGKVIELRAEVEGLRLDSITIFTLEEPRDGVLTKCEVQVVGSNTSTSKATMAVVLLLEGPTGKGVDNGRVALEAFKVKSGKPFDERQRASVQGSALLAATKVYVFVQVTK